MKLKAEKLPPMTEKAFLDLVVRAAHLNGWRVYHTHDSRRSEAGYPDLTMVRERAGCTRSLIFVELKTEKGRLSEVQQMWIHGLSAASQRVYVWRPSDWPAIERVLKGEDPALTVGTGTSGYE